MKLAKNKVKRVVGEEKKKTNESQQKLRMVEFWHVPAIFLRDKLTELPCLSLL